MTPMSIEIDNNIKVAQDSATTTTTLMSTKNDETWSDANEEYDLWHDAAETMENYQEWTDPPTVLKDVNKIEPIIEHITGYQFIHSIFCKIVYFMLFCTFKATVITNKTIIYVFETLSKVVKSTPIAICNWINKSRIRYTKKHRKTSNNSGKFSHNLRASKKSGYNERNCKSGRHGCQHIFMKHKSQTKCVTTNNSSQALEIKGRQIGTFKSPPP